MRKSKSTFSGAGKVVAFSAAALLALAACGEPPSQEGENGAGDEPAEGVAFTWAVTGADRAVHEQVTELWNEENPDRQVEVSWLAATADEQRQAMFQDLQTQAGEFDLLGLDVIWTGEFADFEYIVPLEEMRAEVEENAIPGAVDSAQWQEELYAIPYVANGAFLYYRTDLVDTPPTTWEELREVGLEVAEEEGISAYVAQGDQYEGFVVNYLELFWSAGGSLFNDEQTQSTFLDGDAASTALEWMTESQESGLYADGYDSMVEDDARALFQAGDAVFMRNWPYAYGLMDGEDDEEDSAVVGDFGIAPLPSFEGHESASALGGLNNAVSALADDDAREVAIEFAIWAATAPEVHEILVENTLPPASPNAYEGSDDPVFSVLGEVLENAQARPPVPGYNSLSLAMQDALHPAFRGQGDPQSALQAVDEAANTALETE